MEDVDQLNTFSLHFLAESAVTHVEFQRQQKAIVASFCEQAGYSCTETLWLDTATVTMFSKKLTKLLAPWNVYLLN